VAECLAHLILINAGYFPIIQKIARDGYQPTFQQRLPVLPRLFGSLVLNAVQPQTARKLKANRRFLPTSSAIEGDIVGRFEAHQRDVMDHMAMTDRLDLGSVVITSPVASVATYSLLDAYRILVAHERRHIAQAKRVTAQAGFPARG
jgi:hypothetical protein